SRALDLIEVADLALLLRGAEHDPLALGDRTHPLERILTLRCAGGRKHTGVRLVPGHFERTVPRHHFDLVVDAGAAHQLGETVDGDAAHGLAVVIAHIERSQLLGGQGEVRRGILRVRNRSGGPCSQREKSQGQATPRSALHCRPRNFHSASRLSHCLSCHALSHYSQEPGNLSSLPRLDSSPKGIWRPHLPRAMAMKGFDLALTMWPSRYILPFFSSNTVTSSSFSMWAHFCSLTSVSVILLTMPRATRST